MTHKANFSPWLLKKNATRTHIAIVEDLENAEEVERGREITSNLVAQRQSL